MSVGPIGDRTQRLMMGRRSGRLRSGRAPNRALVWPGASACLLGLAGCVVGPEAVPSAIHLSFAPPVTVDEQRLAEASKGAYVRIRVSEPDAVDVDGRSSWLTTVNDGSGTLVDNAGHVITAAHIIPNIGLTVAAQTIDGQWHPVELIDHAPGRELALLRIDSDASLPAAHRFAGTPVAGEPTLAIGTPDGCAGVVLNGRVLEPHYPGRLGYGEYAYDAAVVLEMAAGPGFSGGPVFDGRGALVGMLIGFALGETSQSSHPNVGRAFAVPAASIQSYLQDVLGRHR